MDPMLDRRAPQFSGPVAASGPAPFGEWPPWLRLAQGGGRLPLLALLLLALATAAYQPRLPAPLTSDARFLAYRNARVLDPGGLGRVWTEDYFAGAMTPVPYRSGYYRPVTNSLFWLEYRWAGERDAAYNLLQVLLHALNAFLLALLVSALTRDRGVGALTGVLFVVHPAHAFAASEPAARADVLFVTFYLLGALAFERALARREGGAPVFLLASVVLLYLLSVLSKEMGITLPAVLSALVLLHHYRDGVPLTRLAWTVPVWVAAGGYVLWRFVLLDLETASMGYTAVHGRAVLVLAALKTLPIHLSRLLLPLGPSYPELNPRLIATVSRPAADPLSYIAVGVVGALVAGALLWRRSPLLAFWCAFFLVSVSPLLDVDSIGGTLDTDVVLAQERWIYLPSVAVLAVLAQGAFRLLRSASPVRQRVLAGACVAVVGGLGISARVHAGRHDDPFAQLRSLYLLPEERLDRMQRANRLMLYANLVALPMGDAVEAEARARGANQLVPDSPLVALNFASVLAARGKWEEAADALRPWFAPTPERLRALHATNFRVYDDVNRVSADVAVLLARAEAHGGRPGAAASTLCEAARRGGERFRVEAAWSELWSMRGRAAPALPSTPPESGGCEGWATVALGA